MVKIKLSDLKPNPFKKFINNGKFNEDIIEKLIEGYKQTKFHENMSARNNNGKIELIYGHHRIEAAKRLYGKNYEINLKVYSIKDFPDEKMLIDMIRENLTQRDTDYRDTSDSIILAKRWLKGEFESKPTLHSRTHGGDRRSQEIGVRQIANFISTQGKTISHTQVGKYIKIEEKLSPKLKEMVGKGDRAGHLEEGRLGFEVSSSLSEIEDEKDQEILANKIVESDLNKDKIKTLLSKYRQSPPEVKEQIKKGIVDLANIDLAIVSYNLRQKKKNKIVVQDIKKKIDGFLMSLSFSNLDVEKSTKEVIKILVILSKYKKDMTDMHKAKLDKQLERLEILYNKMGELITQLREKE